MYMLAAHSANMVLNITLLHLGSHQNVVSSLIGGLGKSNITAGKQLLPRETMAHVCMKLLWQAQHFWQFNKVIALKSDKQFAIHQKNCWCQNGPSSHELALLAAYLCSRLPSVEAFHLLSTASSKPVLQSVPPQWWNSVKLRVTMILHEEQIFWSKSRASEPERFSPGENYSLRGGKFFSSNRFLFLNVRTYFSCGRYPFCCDSVNDMWHHTFTAANPAPDWIWRQASPPSPGAPGWGETMFQLQNVHIPTRKLALLFSHSARVVVFQFSLDPIGNGVVWWHWGKFAARPQSLQRESSWEFDSTFANISSFLSEVQPKTEKLLPAGNALRAQSSHVPHISPRPKETWR